ncbi:sensor histidine kinase [Metabacillus sp. GX 13764]|uniref:sensor histidine kinase n=1 Tax=Metabacillus kandeliae TaxID=2900151 RepID=UPI001E5D6944|nr:sensor histidine kinase [Metabacillus kandeliae]MCD7033642.1 sensor histidine kinase [Metabacillus kandeliae]
MTLFWRTILISCLLSFTILCALAASYFYVIPFEQGSFLLEKKIMDMPFYLFIPFLCLFIGLAYGLYESLFLKKQFAGIAAALKELKNGKPAGSQKEESIQELNEIWEDISSIRSHLSEQVKLSQKLANEKAVDQEKRVQEIVSRERQRLARELHDSVSQQLFAASMLMSAVNENKEEDEAGAKQLKLVEEMIHQSQLEMRALLLHLRPALLKGKTLKEGVEELLAELSLKVPMKISWKMEDVPLDKGIEDHLFRIAQESLSNTLRHSKAKSLEVLLIIRDQLVIFRVMDDGIGFDAQNEKTGSYGLQNMKERALELGGSMKVVSLPGKGTRLEVKIPLLEMEGKK